MDPLADLCGRLKTQAAAAMGMKAYLYTEKGGERVRHARAFLYRDGQCPVESAGKDSATALIALRHLTISRLVTLLDPTLVQSPPGVSSIAVQAVLARLAGDTPGTVPMASTLPPRPGQKRQAADALPQPQLRDDGRQMTACD